MRNQYYLMTNKLILYFRVYHRVCIISMSYENDFIISLKYFMNSEIFNFEIFRFQNPIIIIILAVIIIERDG